MIDTPLNYPYNEVRKMFETAYNCSISQFMKQMKPLIGYQATKIKFTATPFPGTPELPTLLDDLSLNNTLIGLMATNLTAFILSKDAASTFSRLTAWAGKTNMDYTIETIDMLIHRVKDLSDASLISIAYLSYYEAHMYRSQLLSEENIVLPDTKECATLLHMAKRTANVLATYQGICHRPTLEGAYNNVVSRGGPDFMSDDTVWAIRFRKGGPVVNDTMYLLITYVLVTHSTQCEDNPPRYIRVINPVEGMVYSVDMKRVDSLLLRIIRDAIYGLEFANPSMASLTPSQQARLIITTVGLLDTCHLGKEAVAAYIRQSCPFPVGMAYGQHLQEPVIRHFMGIYENGETNESIKKAILALNHLYYYYDYPDAPAGLTVTLTETLLTDLLEKILGY